MQQDGKTQRLLEKHGFLSYACMSMYFFAVLDILLKSLDTSTNHRIIMKYI